MFFAILVFLTISTTGISQEVPALPENEVIEGCVVEYSVLRSDLIGKAPADIIYRITVEVKTKKEISKKMILSKASVPSWIFGKYVKLKAFFSGDEKGGNYWLNSLSIIQEIPCKF